MTVQELNRTPLSQAVKPLCWQPTDNQLYVLQFLMDEMSLLSSGEMPEAVEIELSDWKTDEIWEWVPGRMAEPKMYEMLTSEYVPYTTEDLLALAQKAEAAQRSGTEAEEMQAYWNLAEAIACNLTEYGWDEV